MPIITLVFYIGQEPWDGPRQLYDMFEIPPECESWFRQSVHNYKMHMIDARHISDEMLEQFNGDLKAFFTMLKEDYDQDKLRGVIAKYRETWYAIGAIKNDDRYVELYDNSLKANKSGGEEMDPLFDKIQDGGMAKVNQLNAKLFAAGRIEDVKKACENPDYQKKLFKEFAIGTK